MKKKLNARGFAHWLVLAVVIAVIGGVGTYLLTTSHADSVGSGAGTGGSAIGAGVTCSIIQKGSLSVGKVGSFYAKVKNPYSSDVVASEKLNGTFKPKDRSITGYHSGNGVGPLKVRAKKHSTALHPYASVDSHGNNFVAGATRPLKFKFQYKGTFTVQYKLGTVASCLHTYTIN